MIRLFIAFMLSVSTLDAFEAADKVDSYQGCTIQIGKAGAGGVQALRAECHWPDVTVASARKVLERFDHYGDFITCMKETAVVRTEGPKVLLWQRDELGFMLDDRESQTWMQLDEVAGGFTVKWWRDETFTKPTGDGHLLMLVNEGLWRVVAADDGGVDLTQDLSVDPGGSIPTRLVNWFQTYGMAAEMRELHAHAVIHKPR